MSFLDNLTNPIQIITGLGGVLPEANQFLIGNLILLSFFIIFMIMSLRYDFIEVLLIDCFITTIVAILFYAAGLISILTISYPIVVFAITLVFYLFNNK